MSRRILKNQKFLEYYLEGNDASKEHLIKGANRDQIDSICECMLNVLNKNVRLEGSRKKRLCDNLCHHKKELNIILDRKTPIKKKKLLLVKASTQRGGAILPLILSTVLPLILNALSSK